AELPLFLEESRIKVLRSMRNQVHHGHQKDEMEESFPAPHYIPAVISPVGSRFVPRLGLFNFGTDEKRQQSRQPSHKKQGAPAPVGVNQSVGDGREQKAQGVAFLKQPRKYPS